VFPPNARTKVPMRILRPDDRGGLRDVTREMVGAGELPSMEHPREIVTGDFNRDGRPDLFVSAHGYDTSPFDGETNTLVLSRADGTLANRSSTLPTTPDFSHSAAVADIDGDGILDIYVGNLPGPSP